MQISLNDIKILIDQLAEKISAPQKHLPTYGHSIDSANPHIEIDKNGQLYYVIVERGEELKRDMAANANDLLYKVFKDITFSMAVSFELHNRIDAEDCRRQMFAKQEDLLTILDSAWVARIKKEHQLILTAHPFDDLAIIRADYTKQLTSNGTETSAAWNEACKKYPIPNAG